MQPKPSMQRTLGFAVWSDNIALIRELLDAGAQVDDYGSETATGLAPLMESVGEPESFYATRVTLAQLLLSAGADGFDKDGRTALHYAVGACHKAVEILLAAGADANTTDNRGSTPLHESIICGNVSAVKALCQGGANREVQDREGHTPVDLLAENKDLFSPEEFAAAAEALTA